MIVALMLLLSIGILAQVFLVDVYTVVDIENGKIMPDATFPQTLLRGLRGSGATLIIGIVGIVAVKVNFLLFFKRLGTQITTYLVLWYIVLFITLACSAASLGLVGYKCISGDFEYIVSKCSGRGVQKASFELQIVSVVLDIFSDLFSKSWPVHGSYSDS